jgi:hypothetical protein
MATKKDTTKKKESGTIDIAFLSQLKADAEKHISKMSSNWKKYMQYYVGSQWNSNEKTSLETVDYVLQPDGTYEQVWIVRDSAEYDKLSKNKFAMPRRTRNIIFSIIESQTATMKELMPRISISPYNRTDESLVGRGKKLTMFMNEIINKQTDPIFGEAIKEAGIYGHSPVMIGYKFNPDDAEQIPFYITKESAFDFTADPMARDWKDVRYVFRKIKMYYKEAKKLYGDFLETGQSVTATVIIEEYWVRQDFIDSKNSMYRWNRYDVYGSKILKAVEDNKESFDSYPILPVEMMRLTKRPNTWCGTSDVGLIIDHQDTINKRASQEDYYMSMKTVPPMEVRNDVITSSGKNADDENEVVYPGKIFRSDFKFQGEKAIKPIETQIIDQNAFYASISVAEKEAEDITGVSRSILGNNPKGVYSAKHFGEVQQSAMTRIRDKENLFVSSIESMAIKIITWAKEDLKNGGKYTIIDPETNEAITLKADDFDIDKFQLEVETMDSNLLSVPERIKALTDIKQYAADISSNEIVLAVNNQLPGLFDKGYVDMLKSVVKKERDKKEKELDVAIVSLDLADIQAKAQIKELQMKMEQMNNPQPEQVPQQPQMQQPAQMPQQDQGVPQNGVTQADMQILEQQAQQQEQQNTQPGVGNTLQNAMQGFIIQLVQQGLDEQTAAALGQAAIAMIMESNPGLPEQQYVGLFEQAIQDPQFMPTLEQYIQSKQGGM